MYSNTSGSKISKTVLLAFFILLSGCGSSGLSQLCDIEGDCEGWDSAQLDSCEAQAETLDADVESKGCQSQADAYLNCAEKAGCNATQCAAEEMALKACGVDI